jgi:hypothetical protein
MEKTITINLDRINRQLAAELGGHAQELKAQAEQNTDGAEHFAGIDVSAIQTEFCTIAPQAVAWGLRLIGLFGWISPTASAQLKAFLNVAKNEIIPPVCGG